MDVEALTGWFAGRIPDDWFEGPPEIELDRDEIMVIGHLPSPDVGDAAEGVREGAERSRIEGWREETRAKRIEIASEAEHRFRRKVSWGATCGETRSLFTTFSAPVMTR